MARPKEFEIEDALDKAVEVFWEKGYEATSIQDLVTKMNINRGSLYDTFGNKQQLFLLVMDRYGEIVIGKLLSILNKTEASESSNAIPLFFKAVIDHIVNNGQLRGCLVTNSAIETALSSPLIVKKVELIIHRIEDCFYTHLLENQKTNASNPTNNIRALARYLTSGLQGLLIIGKIKPERDFLQDIVDMQLRILK